MAFVEGALGLVVVEVVVNLALCGCCRGSSRKLYVVEVAVVAVTLGGCSQGSSR